MTARLLSGREVSRVLVAEVRETVAALSYIPKLVFVRVGEDPASASYVRSKARLAERAGISSQTLVLPEETRQEELMDLVARLNADDEVDGILVQLPLPSRLEGGPVLNAIRPDKDVDGLHPVNVGRLWKGEAGLFPATPAGLVRILDYYDIPIQGKRAVVVGRSSLVGKPAAALLLRRDATVTLAHSRTRDLTSLTREADILIPAVGRPGMITPEMVKPGATVLDVGQSPVDGELRGDVHPDVAEVAGALTPTPGGTGPMTVAMVIQNTVDAARTRRGLGD